MKTLSYILSLVSFCVLCSCDKKTEPKVTGSLYGSVTDKATGEPVKNAGIELMPIGISVKTGDDGNFEFVQVEQGKYTLHITKSGYYAGTKDIFVNGDDKDKPVNILLEKLPAALTILDANQQEIDSLDFGAAEGENIRSFIIFNNSDDILDWSIIHDDYVWVREISKTEGKLKAHLKQTIHIKIDRSKLLTGKNYAILLISSDNGSKDLRMVAVGGDFIETLPATDVKAVTSILNGQITRRPPSELKEYGFVYSLKPTPSVHNGATKAQIHSEPNVAKFSYSVSELEKLKTYYFRAYASTSDSTFYGAEEQFTTTDGLPEVETNNIDDPQPYMAIGGGIVKNDGGYHVKLRGVCWSSVNTIPSIESDPSTNDGEGSGPFVSNISPLKLGTTYYVRAYAQNEQGLNYGSPKSFKTPSGVPELITIQPTSTTTTISTGGNITSDGGFPITERGICYSETRTKPTINDDNYIPQGTGIGKYSITITGLKAHTQYYIRAYARNNHAEQYGDAYPVYTQFGPVDVYTAEITDITANTAIGGVSVTDLGGANLESCGICWGTTSTPTLSNAFVEGGTMPGTYICRMANLTSGMKYYVRAYAKTENGTTYGGLKSFTTKSGMPKITTTMPTVTATTITSGGIITSNDGGPIEACGICYSTTNNQPEKSDGYVSSSDISNNFSVVLSGLARNTTYYIRAFATNNNGTAYGNVQTATTLNGKVNITTSAVTNITSESAVGGYQITNTGGVSIQTAGICWSTSRTPTTNDRISVGGTSIGTFSCALSGLSPNTTYYVRAYAISELGVTYGSQISFATLAKSDYVDLGLPSGKKWRDHNESGRYDYDSASRSFGSKLPTKAQWDELVNLCTWRWTGSGYIVTGLNGNYIILPAEGLLSTNGALSGDGIFGYYRSSDKIDTDNAWYLIFSSSSKSFSGYSSHDKMSVRLIQ